MSTEVDPEELGTRAEGIAVGVLAPLLGGGNLQLQRPVGSAMALSMGTHRDIVDNDVRTLVDNARIRVARSVVPLDVLKPLSPVIWSLLCVVNNVVQATNHELSTVVSRGRHRDLIGATRALLEQIPPCQNLDEAVERHSTFSRLLELRRIDTTVSWWTGSQTFRGSPPPPRLVAWPGLRRVRIDTANVHLADMIDGVDVPAGDYEELLNRLLDATPLTNLMEAARSRPGFIFGPQTVGLLSSVAGANLAIRAIARKCQSSGGGAHLGKVVAAVQAAHQRVSEPPAGPIVGQFLKDLLSSENWISG